MNLKQNGVLQISQTYNYDKMNRLKDVYNQGKLVATYTYDLNGNRSSLQYGNGVMTTYIYNKSNLVTNISSKKSTSSLELSDYSYSYYLDGNQASETDNLSAAITTYSYDGLNRLTNEKETIGNKISSKTYTYDKNNNRKTMSSTQTGAASYTTTYDYDTNNRLLKETKDTNGVKTISDYSYDDNGNQTTKKIGGVVKETNTYDSFNRLINVSNENGTTKYNYKPDGLRLSKTVNGVLTTHVWDGSNIVLEFDSSNNIINQYIRGIDLIKNKDNYYLYNAHGDVKQLSMSSFGFSIRDYNYDSFGVEQSQITGDTNPFRYCGEYTDLETNTVYLRNRNYNPSNGRFTTEEPIGAGLNWYTYCGNNPVNRIDPWGLDSYVLWASYGYDERETENNRKQAEIRAEEYEKKHRTKCWVIEVNSAGQFADAWNGMGSVDGNTVTIDAVEVISHGHYITINGERIGILMFDGSNFYAKGYEGIAKNGRSMSDLLQKDMKSLYFSACNTANPDFNLNIVVAFFNNNPGITSVSGWDGGVKYWGSHNSKRFWNYGQDLPLPYEEQSTFRALKKPGDKRWPGMTTMIRRGDRTVTEHTIYWQQTGKKWN